MLNEQLVIEAKENPEIANYSDKIGGKLDTFKYIKGHLSTLKTMANFHIGSILFIMKVRLRERFFFKKITAKGAHAVYIGYRDEKLRDLYRDIKLRAKLGYTSTTVLLNDKETAHQFKFVLEKDKYLVKIKENMNKISSYTYDLQISWAADDQHEMNKYI